MSERVQLLLSDRILGMTLTPEGRVWNYGVGLAQMWAPTIPYQVVLDTPLPFWAEQHRPNAFLSVSIGALVGYSLPNTMSSLPTWEPETIAPTWRIALHDVFFVVLWIVHILYFYHPIFDTASKLTTAVIPRDQTTKYLRIRLKVTRGEQSQIRSRAFTWRDKDRRCSLQRPPHILRFLVSSLLLKPIATTVMTRSTIDTSPNRQIFFGLIPSSPSFNL